MEDGINTNNDSTTQKTQYQQKTPEERLAELEQMVQKKDQRIQDKETMLRKLQSQYDRKIAEISKQSFQATVPPPDESKYNNADEYMRDRIKWELKSNIKIDELIRQEIRSAKEMEEIGDRKKRFEINVSKVKSEYPDFEDIARSDIMLSIYNNSSNGIADVLEDLEEGPKIAYYLGNNIDIAHKMASLPPSKLVAELVKLTSKTDMKPNIGGNSAPPINPVSGGSVRGNTKKTWELSTDEWLELQKKQTR